MCSLSASSPLLCLVHRIAPADEPTGTVCMGASSSGEFVSVVRKKKNQAASTTGEDCVECSLITWNIPQTEFGICRTLTESAGTIYDFRIRENEKFVNICPHDGFRTLSVIFSSSSVAQSTVPNSCAIRWLKYDYYDGSLLFERFLGRHVKRPKDKGRNMVNAIPAGSLMWFLYDGRAGLWDPRYGVELANVATYLSHPVPMCIAAQLSLLAHSCAMVTPIDVASSHLACYSLTMCIRDANGTSNSVFQTVLKVAAALTTGDARSSSLHCLCFPLSVFLLKFLSTSIFALLKYSALSSYLHFPAFPPICPDPGSICNALGRIRTPTLAATGKYFLKAHMAKVKMSETTILSKLPLKMQNQLLNARKNVNYDEAMSLMEFFDSRRKSLVPIPPDRISHAPNHTQHQYKKMKFTPQQWSNITRSSVDAVLDLKKEKVLYLTLPTPTVSVSMPNPVLSCPEQFVSVTALPLSPHLATRPLSYRSLREICITTTSTPCT